MQRLKIKTMFIGVWMQGVEPRKQKILQQMLQE